MTVLILALFVAMLATWWMASGRSRLAMIDHPNERSLHELPVPRSGGIAILLAIAAGWGWLSAIYGLPESLVWIIASVVSVAVVSILDDLYNLSVRIRLPIHMLAAVLVLLGGGGWSLGIAGVVVSFLAIVWMINLYNFMDGMDGFAGGMTLVGFAFLGIGGYMAGDSLYAEWCWVVAAAVSGFLLFNFPPARIFMGDAGSATLGLLAASLSLLGVHKSLFPLWFPLMLFSPFWVDATVTLMRRAWRREKVWQAHREHYYQRLVRTGWGHKKTVLAEYALMLASSGSAFALLMYPEWWVIGLLVWGAIYLILAHMVDLFFARRQDG